MGQLIKQIALLERMDQLIRLKATGSPKQLANRLQVSEATVFRTINAMKELGAPITYELSRQTYAYTQQTTFRCGFFLEELDGYTQEISSGGCTFQGFKKKLPIKWNDFQNLRVTTPIFV